MRRECKYTLTLERTGDTSALELELEKLADALGARLTRTDYEYEPGADYRLMTGRRTLRKIGRRP